MFALQLRTIPRIHIERKGQACCCCTLGISALGGRNRRMPGAGWTASLLGELQGSERPVFKRKKKKGRKKGGREEGRRKEGRGGGRRKPVTRCNV